MTNNRTALVTGATRGIGLATAQALAADGWQVWLGARDPEGAARSAAGWGRTVRLDVTDDASVLDAVATLEEAGGLDLLVNNAGVGGRWVGPAETVPQDFLPVYGVNVLGPVRVTHAFLPMLRERKGRVVMVSSSMGSLTVTTDPAQFESTLHGLVYQSSKAALNMVTTQYAKAIPEVAFVAVDPGYTATDLNGHAGYRTPQEAAATVLEGCSAAVATGTFWGVEGVVPW